MSHRLISMTVVTAAIVVGEGVALAADPTTADCLAASDASLTMANQHKLRGERAQLLICAASTCPADVRKECLRRVDEVNAQMPTIVFTAKDGTGAELSAVKVSMDGEVLAQRLEGTGLSIDPGQHKFTFETPGQAPLTKSILIVEGQKDRREQVVFGGGKGAEPAPSPSPAPASTSPVTTPPAPPPDTTSDSGGGLGTQKVLALVAGGIGVIGLGLGTAFGLSASSKKNDAQAVCPNQCATPDGVSKWNDAASAARASDIGFVIGAVGLVGGAVLWFTAPTGAPSGTQVGVGPGMVQLKGAW